MVILRGFRFREIRGRGKVRDFIPRRNLLRWRRRSRKRLFRFLFGLRFRLYFWLRLRNLFRLGRLFCGLFRLTLEIRLRLINCIFIGIFRTILLKVGLCLIYRLFGFLFRFRLFLRRSGLLRFLGVRFGLLGRLLLRILGGNSGAGRAVREFVVGGVKREIAGVPAEARNRAERLPWDRRD
jgi:hypothetical protein